MEGIQNSVSQVQAERLKQINFMDGFLHDCTVGAGINCQACPKRTHRG